MEPIHEGHGHLLCVDVLGDGKQSRASQSAGNPRKPHQFKSLLSIKIDTRNGPKELKSQTNSQFETTILVLLITPYLIHSSICRVPIDQPTQSTPRKEQPAYQTDADGTEGSSGANTNSNSNFRNFPSLNSTPSNNRGKLKRQRGDEDREDHPDGQGGGRSPTSKPVEESHLKFACPFFYADKVKYWDCHRFHLNRVSDVRQHIRRKHTEPLHCQVCGEEFPNPDAWHQHVALRACEPRNFPQPWASGTQLDLMDAAAKSNSPSEQDRWYMIWDILFSDVPDVPRPVSPYIFDTYWGIQMLTTPDVVRQYQSQQSYRLLVSQQIHLGDRILSDLIRAIRQNFTSSIPNEPQNSIRPAAHFLHPSESLSQPNIPSISRQTFQPSISSNQQQSLYSNMLVQPQDLQRSMPSNQRQNLQSVQSNISSALPYHFQPNTPSNQPPSLHLNMSSVRPQDFQRSISFNQPQSLVSNMSVQPQDFQRSIPSDQRQNLQSVQSNISSVLPYHFQQNIPSNQPQSLHLNMPLVLPQGFQLNTPSNLPHNHQSIQSNMPPVLPHDFQSNTPSNQPQNLQPIIPNSIQRQVQDVTPSFTPNSDQPPPVRSNPTLSEAPDYEDLGWII
ncbi:hypothetical protein F4805DRAFT_452827 [Annulohypoxylon moriforme]|nr:hypothetical protein F4805DRAFT_452827 [Annulohypoxylon moriforme]